MKKLLVLNFFPAFFPPSSGGEMRYFHLYSQLSTYFDITLLSPTYSHHQREVITHSSTFREHRIPKETIHDQIHMNIAKENIAEEISALVFSLSAHYFNNYHKAYLELQADADCIIHEFPFTIDYDLFMGLDDRPRIYNSHNIESNLMRQIWKGKYADKYLRHLVTLEKRLISISELCFAVSASEAKSFGEKYLLQKENFKISENGIFLEEFLPRKVSKGNIITTLFFGSFHPPNLEATQFIIDDLAPTCPDIKFIIAGNCVPKDIVNFPPNVKILGRVDDEKRLELFSTVTVALNPMFSGSGTNLKALEYLAAGMPMISTDTGARGIGLINGKNVLITEKDNFAKELKIFVQNTSLLKLISNTGKQHVADNFSWESIARKSAEHINQCLGDYRKPQKKKLLVLNDFSVSNPYGGGEVRINRIYSSLSKFYQITLLCFTNEEKIKRVEITPDFIEIQIPKSQEHHNEEKKYSIQWHISANDIISHLQGVDNKLINDLAATLYKKSDAIILSHPYMVSLIENLKGTPVIYESLNVETVLKKDLLIGHPSYDYLVSLIEKIEKKAISMSSEILLVSETDKDGMLELNANKSNLHIVRNGVDIPRNTPDKRALEHIRVELNGRPLIVFLGSAHPPNVEAVGYILFTLASQLPDCVFAIIGSVCNSYANDIPENVLMLGLLEKNHKDIWVELANLAINPMHSGSGSNLKLAEFFAKSLPTITTPFGARGYNIENGKQAIICEKEKFPTEIASLICNASRMESIGKQAFSFAKNSLDWHIQANKFRYILEKNIFAKKKQKLLIITFRFTEPPLGGAESYLLELIKELDRKGEHAIDVATLDIIKIENQFHFSTKYECDPNILRPNDIASLNYYSFPVDEISIKERLENSRKISKVWMEESRVISCLHIDVLPDFILMGGWYFPEKVDSKFQIWSSEKALLRVKNSEYIIIKGFSPIKNYFSIQNKNKEVFSQNINGNFELKIEVNGAEIIEIRMKSSFYADHDERSLGILINSIQFKKEHALHDVSLEVSYKDILKRELPSEYIQDLINIAEERSDKIEKLFQVTRGPNSKALEGWLDENSTNYDVIIGHCCPFKTMVMAADAAKKADVPLIQIPHVHIDDDFYHWRYYFDALRVAKVSMVHPKAAIPLFFDKISAKSSYLPHGLFPESPTEEDEKNFNELYNSNLPFFLVLGRKDSLKNYHLAIEAVKELNRNKRTCNLIMIGRDEDGIKLDPKDVLYLGGQPRGIVLAAIKSSKALISMSDSESFGIVILESWAQGTPVIISDACHASTELVVNEKNGLWANKDNLKNKIEFILDSPIDSIKMGQKGRELQEKKFSWEKVGLTLSQIILNSVQRGN